MYIMSKDRTVIIKPNTIWLSKSDNDDMLNIVASNGDKNYILGTYFKEFANEEFKNIFTNFNNEYERTYLMSSVEDSEKYSISVMEDDIPF